jgi:hypothetical protein
MGTGFLPAPNWLGGRDGLIANYQLDFTAYSSIMIPLDSTFQGDRVLPVSMWVDNSLNFASVITNVEGEINIIPPYSSGFVYVKGCNDISFSCLNTKIIISIQFSDTVKRYVLDVAGPVNVGANMGNVKGNFKGLRGLGSANAMTFSADVLVLSNNASEYRTVNGYYAVNASAYGVGLNGIDVGAWQPNSIYAVYALYNGVDFKTVASLNHVNPGNRFGYDYWCKIGSFCTDGAGALLPFVQVGYETEFVISIGGLLQYPIIVNGAYGSVIGPTWQAIQWTALAPPNARRLRLRSRFNNTITTADYIYISNTSNNALPASSTVFAGLVAGLPSMRDDILLCTDNNYFGVITSSNACYIHLKGYTDSF